MKKTSLLILSFFVLSNCLAQKNVTKKQEVDYVNPLIGTAATGFAKGLDGGGTMPSVGPPFAMTNFVAQTGESYMSRMNYIYEDSSIIGFLASHQPTVWMGDYGYVSVMPQTGNLKVLPNERALTYNHANEISTPYYYSVLLDAADKQQIKAEIASTSRCGILQFTFPASQRSHLIIQVKQFQLWMKEGVMHAGSILILVGAGGVFGAILKKTALADIVKNVAEKSEGSMLLFLLIAWLMGVLLKTAQGSTTSAIIIVTSIMAPLAASAGFDTNMELSLLLAAIAGGAMVVSHANDAYFWVISQFSGLSMQQTYKTFSLATVFMGVSVLIMVLLLALVIL